MFNFNVTNIDSVGTTFSKLPKLIPHGSRLWAFVNSVSMEDTHPESVAKEGAKFVKVEFEVLEGQAKGITVVSKFKINHLKNAQKEIENLSVLDKICGGTLIKRAMAGQTMVDDAALKSAFEVGAKVFILISQWEYNGDTGNNVVGVADKGEDLLNGEVIDKPMKKSQPQEALATTAAASMAVTEAWETDL
jgi:hypothetical protein